MADFWIAVASDISLAAERTYKRNFPETPFVRTDLRKLSAGDLLDAAGGMSPDIVCGGPPCQGFSTLGAKLSSDPRNSLFASFARIVSELQPRFVLMENVGSVLSMYGGQYRDAITRRFSDLGYRVSVTVLNAADYGAPQIRKRAFFFGTRQANPFSFPLPEYGGDRTPYVTAWEAIGDLAEAGPKVPNNTSLRHSERVVARYRLVPEGGRLPPPDQLPAAIRRTNFGNTYKRLHRARPSLTLVPGNNAFPIHPTLDRSLTPREAARLQSFPDWFIFEGDRRQQCILVGSAVPPLLGRAIGRKIRSHARRDRRAGNNIEQQTAPLPSSGDDRGREGRVIPSSAMEVGDSGRGFVDLFSGAGGFTIGFARAGWKPLLDVDNSPSVRLTHLHNFPSIPFLPGDLFQSEVRDEIVEKLRGKEVGVVVGGPPCQGFSIFGKRRFVNTRGYDPHADPRNALVYAFMDLVRRLSPRWFVMENVPGLVSLDRGQLLARLMAEFQQMGYRDVQSRVLNGADYGVPQLRRRLLVVGNRTGHVIPWPKRKYFERPRDWQSPYRTVGEVISDLADEKSYERFSCHEPMKHKPLLVERYKLIPEGGRLNLTSLPPHLRKGYRTHSVSNYSHIFRRLHRDQPSITLVPGHNAFPIHPWLDRALTVREAARIQTFPDELEFKGSRQEQCIQVGNAFPPLLAEVVANNIQKAEANGWLPGKVPSSAFYALVERPDPAQMPLPLLD